MCSQYHWQCLRDSSGSSLVHAARVTSGPLSGRSGSATMPTRGPAGPAPGQVAANSRQPEPEGKKATALPVQMPFIVRALKLPAAMSGSPSLLSTQCASRQLPVPGAYLPRPSHGSSSRLPGAGPGPALECQLPCTQRGLPVAPRPTSAAAPFGSGFSKLGSLLVLS